MSAFICKILYAIWFRLFHLWLFQLSDCHAIHNDKSNNGDEREKKNATDRFEPNVINFDMVRFLEPFFNTRPWHHNSHELNMTRFLMLSLRRPNKNLFFTMNIWFDRIKLNFFYFVQKYIRKKAYSFLWTWHF